MQLTIDGKKCDLNFGVEFVNQLNKVAGFSIEKSGIDLPMGMALQRVNVGLTTYDPSMLSKAIYAATWDNDPRPSLKACGQYLDGLTLKQLEDVFAKVKKGIEDSTVLQLSLKNVKM